MAKKSLHPLWFLPQGASLTTKEDPMANLIKPSTIINYDSGVIVETILQSVRL